MKKLFSVFFLALLAACRVDPEIRPELPADRLTQSVPAGWPQPVYRLSDEMISEDKFRLGRELFYETRLSRDNTISCGSCHQNFVAFANADHDVSHGVDSRTGTRNSPGMFNLAWHPTLMHDGGVNHLEVQPLAPIANPVEMDEDINRVLQKLSDSPKYRDLFNKAYGSEEISSDRMLKSMALFMALITSSESKYDRYKRGQSQFSAQELRGYALFSEKCSSCHTEPLFSDFAYRNNGLAVDPRYNDSGRAVITRSQNDLYRFKTPSLRNISITAPYMHDGRYATLEQCLDHYTSGIQNHTNLDPRLEYGIPMTPGEKTDIIAFLYTLTDYELIKDKRFSDPNFR